MNDSNQTPHRWGMAIDLDRCTGCQACVAACHAENNLPLSDPESAGKGRAVHWIRVDRYYEGEFPEIRVKYMPVLCQHCDEAPCEPVCPVYATYKNPEGLNVQVYNRCVGTRYCANNCPYSVRFFNWFDPVWPSPLGLPGDGGRLRHQRRHEHRGHDHQHHSDHDGTRLVTCRRNQASAGGQPAAQRPMRWANSSRW